MRARLTKLGAALAALAALAVGGSALASAADNGSQPALAPSVSQADTDSIQDESGKDDASEPASSEKESASESETGSEVPGDDGPGGYADEPGNPNAETQQEGEH